MLRHLNSYTALYRGKSNLDVILGVRESLSHFLDKLTGVLKEPQAISYDTKAGLSYSIMNIRSASTDCRYCIQSLITLQEVLKSMSTQLI